MLLSVRTIYGAEVLSAQAANLELGMAPHSTVNEALTIGTVVPFLPPNINQGSYTPTPYDFTTDTNSLHWQYVMIGMGGHAPVIDQGTGVSYNQPVIHLATDACLYRPIPWLVTTETGPTDTQANLAAGYRLRRTMIIGGVLRVAYYARLMAAQTSTVTPVIGTNINGVKTSEPFTPSINNLTPVAPAVGVNTTGRYAAATVAISIPFATADFANIQDACQILYGNPNLAQVSEIAICSGLDKPINAAYDGAGSSITVPTGLVDAAAVQCNAFITFAPITAANSSGALEFDLGCSEPLYGAAQ